MPRLLATAEEWSRLRAVEQFLAREAWLLDHWHLATWLETLSPKIRYFAPTRHNAMSIADEPLGSAGHQAYFDDTFETLTLRVRRMQTGRAWSEEPRSRTRRFVSNIVLLDLDGDRMLVGSNLLMRREDAAENARFLSAYREDLLVGGASGIKLESRHILLDHLTVPPLTLIL